MENHLSAHTASHWVLNWTIPGLSFFIFAISLQLTVNNICWGLYLSCRYLVLGRDFTDNCATYLIRPNETWVSWSPTSSSVGRCTASCTGSQIPSNMFHCSSWLAFACFDQLCILFWLMCCCSKRSIWTLQMINPRLEISANRTKCQNSVTVKCIVKCRSKN